MTSLHMFHEMYIISLFNLYFTTQALPYLKQSRGLTLGETT